MPSRREVLLMLRADEREYQSLLEVAGRICRQMKGDQPSLRALIDLQTVGGWERALEEAVHAAQHGSESVLLCASADYDAVEEVAVLVREIRTQTGMWVSLCMGERPYDAYALWRQAGAEEYLLPHDCCNPHLYARLHPGHSPAERLTRCLWLRGLNYRVAGGICVGVPGQTSEDVADDLEVLRNSGVSGVVLRSVSEEVDVLRVLAIARLCLPDADLWVATDDPVQQARSLTCGANILATTRLEGTGPRTRLLTLVTSG
ncbi:hypothetical protein [Symbiobacterium terraclitae]|uniref:hypothetical protein n=1 Tax=Symbiobacterium terraclitae TaxID=557451 RepID=UPI0035B5508D